MGPRDGLDTEVAKKKFLSRPYRESNPGGLVTVLTKVSRLTK